MVIEVHFPDPYKFGNTDKYMSESIGYSDLSGETNKSIVIAMDYHFPMDSILAQIKNIENIREIFVINDQAIVMEPVQSRSWLLADALYKDKANQQQKSQLQQTIIKKLNNRDSEPIVYYTDDQEKLYFNLYI